MTWLTWRQFRVQAFTAAAVLVAFAILLAASGPHLARLYAASGITGCQAASCGQLASNFLQQVYAAGTYWLIYLFGVLIILAAPAIIGIFWGAPLIARELESGTSAVAWNQSVTRTRWLAVKLATGGLLAVAVTEGLSLMQGWWAAPIGRAVSHGGSGTSLAMNEFSSLVFATHGITPIGYAAFAFTLGATLGTLIRRTVPAMALTLAIFAAVQIIMPLWVRPQLFSPHHTTIAIGRGITLSSNSQGNFVLTTGSLPGQPQAWILSSEAADAAGHHVGTAPSACLQEVVNGASSSALDCLSSRGIRIAVTYQPASRYWAFQWTETAIYLALTLALAGYCFRRLGRRLS
jgi:ABC-type transport system involved in multi-copper enzyme maturation permease subunit